MVTIDEKIIKKVEELTMTDYEAKGNQVPAENIEAMIEDLLLEIEKLEEKYNDLEERIDTYYYDKFN